MSYEVFALKYRPKTFHDVVGQETVANTLQRAVATDRVANAFLFCGSRGVGKTSMARILSKALNCPNAKDGEPCSTCATCQSIAAGEDIDVIEIDGASNRGIDDIRAVRDGAAYVPSRSRYKIYIIDEVHMLTIQAFNALLKVLEEPPAHVKFIFATTDPTALPDTILSRCQRHEFKRIQVEDIVARLAKIARLEGVEADEEALRAIAARAEGGLRDSVSLLDQVISFAGKKFGVADLSGALGLLPREHLERFISAIAAGDLAQVVKTLTATIEAGLDLQELLGEIIQTYHSFMLWHVEKKAVRPGPEHALFEKIAPQMGLDRVQYVLRLFLNAKGEIRRAGHERIQIELTALKAARSTAFLPVDEILERLRAGVVVQEPPRGYVPPAAPPRSETPSSTGAATAENDSAPARESFEPQRTAWAEGNAFAEPPRRSGGEGMPEAKVPAPAAPSSAAPFAADNRPAAPSAPPPSAAPSGPIDAKDIGKSWMRIIGMVRHHSAVIASALADARPTAIEGRRLLLELPAAKKFHLTTLNTREAMHWLADAVTAVTGQSFVPSITAAPEGKAAIASDAGGVYDDPNVRKLIEAFDGGIVNVEKDHGEGV